jgi:hypothetical protein
MSLLAPIAPILHSPLPWVIVAGLFAGAALSQATRRTRNKKDPGRAATIKWVLACVYLSAAVIVGLIAVFVPGPSRIIDPRLAWVGGVAAVAAFLAVRFKRAMGVPVMVLLIALAATLALFLQSVHAFTGETEIASLRAISVDSSSMRLELVPRGAEPVLLTMRGTYFSPIVKVVIFSDLLVFLGARTWYRFEGMTSFDQNLRQQDTDFHFARPGGISERLWRVFEKYDTRIPGVKTAQIDLVVKRAKEFATYGIRVQNDGGVEVVEKPG